ncbi:uncharacterized protein LOC141808297 isoform X2 [Halichoeres trimaculatus]|uniref:uncharacterized protein LOC141808297 isoform X2 n=1 Tax=Halichoeres trimaculatus TaxID=147232 RepID=UPI003D9F9421
MEKNKKTPLLFLLLSLPCIHVKGTVPNCTSEPDKNLSCYSDYNQTITCSWHSPHDSDSHCKVYAEKATGYSDSCHLKPVDVSRPALKKCSMLFDRGPEMFFSTDKLIVELRCAHVKKNPVTSIFFIPYCHVKLNPPEKPKVNATSMTLRLAKERDKIRNFIFQLQWKQEDKLWREALNVTKECEWSCITLLHSESLIQGEKYEARVRVQPGTAFGGSSVWSEWSPSGSWVSHIGRRREPPADGSWTTSAVVICSVLVVLLLTVLTLKSNQTICFSLSFRIFLTTKVKGQPFPKQAPSSLNFQNYLNPQLRAFFKPLDIASVEIATSVDDISPIKPEAELPDKMRNESGYESTNSSFSNPSYAHVCSAPPPPVSLLTSAGNLDPCAPDTPYGPVCCQGEDKDSGQKREEFREKEVKIRELFSKDCNKDEPVLVISDYEKVDKLQMERFRLQSLDSGVGSGEEVSQESLEADSINMTESNEEDQEETELEKEKGVLQKLFGGSVDIFGKDSIQVCSDYERVQKLQPDSPEPQNLSVNNEIQEQFDHQESLEDTDKSTESTNLLASPCSFSSVTTMSSNFGGPVLKPVLHCNILALMSSSRSMELSGDDYMPVRQDQS